jgi:hypothetical protein
MVFVLLRLMALYLSYVLAHRIQPMSHGFAVEIFVLWHTYLYIPTRVPVSRGSVPQTANGDFCGVIVRAPGFLHPVPFPGFPGGSIACIHDDTHTSVTVHVITQKETDTTHVKPH